MKVLEFEQFLSRGSTCFGMEKKKNNSVIVMFEHDD